MVLSRVGLQQPTCLDQRWRLRLDRTVSVDGRIMKDHLCKDEWPYEHDQGHQKGFFWGGGGKFQVDSCHSYENQQSLMLL